MKIKQFLQKRVFPKLTFVLGVNESGSKRMFRGMKNKNVEKDNPQR